MAKFSIECTQSLGMSHHGEVIAEGESTVDLTDEEVKTLVELIREKDTTDVEELELEENYPDLYEKLREAYYDMAYRAEEIQCLRDGLKNHCVEYDADELMEYCKEHCGYKFEYDEADFYYEPIEDLEEGEEPEVDEDALMEAESDDFESWLRNYVDSLSDNEAYAFICNHMEADLWIDNVSYEVGIPAAIIEMAKG